jgi:lipid II:glycine glycyltransferase (peptidoglycan interpeptide bridge formation enzyme)
MVALTIGMPTYNDFDGVFFSIQALRMYQDMEDTELLVVDNYGCENTRQLVEDWVHGRYILATDVVGTAAAKNRVLDEASGDAVLCCDSHVLFVPGVISRLKQYYRDHPDSIDLLQGPLVYDDLESFSTHFDGVWSGGMWGTWATDPRGQDSEGEPFEIPMMGMGAFSCRKEAWLGFNPAFRGFGGEEGYIHEKFRQAGAHCLCLPWLRWLHRFERPKGIPYRLTVEDKLRNYVIGFTELGLDLTPALEHFTEMLPEETIADVTEQALQEGISAPPGRFHVKAPTIIPSPPPSSASVTTQTTASTKTVGPDDNAQASSISGPVIGQDDWDAALEELGGTLMQSWLWGELLQQLGYIVERVRVDGPRGIGLAQFVIENEDHGRVAHISRGPIISGEWPPVARQLFDAVDKLAAQHGAVSVLVEPDAPLPPDASFEELGFGLASQPHYSPAGTVRIPLFDDDAILARMHKGTRNKLRRAQRHGVRISKHLSTDNAAMTVFYELLQDTSHRNGFEIAERSYYDNFMSVAGEEAALFLAYVGDIPAAGIIVVRAVQEAVSMFGASSTEHRVQGATAYLEFEAMRWARDRGCTQYDLFGISTENLTSSGKWHSSPGGDGHGFTASKLGFGGEIIRYPSAYQRPVQQIASITEPVHREATSGSLFSVHATSSDRHPPLPSVDEARACLAIPSAPTAAPDDNTYTIDTLTGRSNWNAVLKELGGSMVQSWQWGEMLKRYGYTVERVLVKGAEGAGLAEFTIEDQDHGPTAHIQRGPVIAGEWVPVARQLLNAVDEIAARHGAVSMIVEPDAPLPPDAAYEKLGFMAAPQPYYSLNGTVRVPLLDDSALLNQMRPGTRTKIRRGQKSGIRVIPHPTTDAKAMAIFYELLESTSRRKGFELEERSYYETTLSAFGEDSALLLAYLGDTPVAGVVVFCTLHEAISMFSATSTEHRVRGAADYLRYECMRWARERGCTRYDLFGISIDYLTRSGEGQKSNSGDQHTYTEFKIGFGGEIIKYPPAWQRPVRNTADALPETTDPGIVTATGA